MHPPGFVVIGAGGYALDHFRAVRWLQEQQLGHLAGAVILKRDQKRNPRLLAALCEQDVPVYHSVNNFLQNKGPQADILTVPIGIHMHAQVVISALKAGLHVYCEKPLAATIQEVDSVREWQKRTGLQVAVGFQHLYSNSIRKLKSRIVDGRLGEVAEISLMCGWPRSRAYYARNNWTGRMQSGGRWVLDSPANNAHAHFLLNMLFLAAREESGAEAPSSVRAELYRANLIESPDTVQVHFTMETGALGYAVLTHCNGIENGPFMHVKCNGGEVRWETGLGKTTILYNNGGSETFDNAIHEHWRYDGIMDIAMSIRDDRVPLCGPDIARCHTLTINAIHESCPRIVGIPDDCIEELEDWEVFPPDTRGHFRRAVDMDDYLAQAFQTKKLLSELDVPWAEGKISRTVQTQGYSCFPQASELQHGIWE